MQWQSDHCCGLERSAVYPVEWLTTTVERRNNLTAWPRRWSHYNPSVFQQPLAHVRRQIRRPFSLGLLRDVIGVDREHQLEHTRTLYTKVEVLTFVRHVCLSVRLSVGMEQLVSHWSDFNEIQYLRIFRNPIERMQISLKPDKNNGYLTWRPTYIYDISLKF